AAGARSTLRRLLRRCRGGRRPPLRLRPPARPPSARPQSARPPSAVCRRSPAPSPALCRRGTTGRSGRLRHMDFSVRLAELDPPSALGPLDGRYRSVTAPLVDHLSEAALNRARVHVEVEWLIHLTQSRALPGAPQLSPTEVDYLRAIPRDFGAAQIGELATIEAETRHDVKAVEYFLKRRLAQAPEHLGEATVLPSTSEIVHIFCTSEDINNLAYALTVRSAIAQVWLPAAEQVQADLAQMARTYAHVPMLARTHGQAATPVTLGKELAVLAYRLKRQLHRIRAAQYLGKINGATGTYAAHIVAVPDTD